ncbi:acid phosphatase protein [Apiospora rasikravindrae]|uniref:Acid phosphatase protein n=1 Tax=Apiospora rasikravindrae TaxID=990691 RepID=A0ABR1SN60_9PEZI
MLSIVAMAVRGLLLLSAAVVLGLSVSNAKYQVFGNPPPETSFGSFTGAFGVLVSLVGLAALFVDKIPTFFVMAADALASIFFLAGGIALTLAMKDVSSCTGGDKLGDYQRVTNKLLNGGCTDGGNDVTYCGISSSPHPFDELHGRCQRVQADYVFEFIAFIFGVVIIALGWVLHRKGGSGTRSYV